jgi:2-polyprenyl-3-methyl-5-hydroxy-6-metoxy-1,4-benzoquinol methylase
MLSISECPLCSSNDLAYYLTCKDHLVSKKDFILNTCNSCGFIFTNPVPDANVIGEYYKSDQYISHSDTRKGIISRLYHSVRNISVKKKWKLIEEYVSRGTILDFGCGTGYFLSHANTKKWNCIGVEPDAGARALAMDKIKQVYETLPIESPAFNVISLWHVLEHLPNLKVQLSLLIQKLSSEGIIIIAVPNPKSYDAEFYGKDWAAYDVPRHLYHFNQTQMLDLIQSYGLKHLKTIGMPADAFYVSLLTEQRRNTILALSKAFCIGLFSNLKAQFTTEYSSLIYIFKKP